VRRHGGQPNRQWDGVLHEWGSDKDATNVSTGTTITVNFSESVDLTASAFTVECPVGTSVAFTGRPTLPAQDTSSVVLTPASALPAGTVCTVKAIAAQITDNDGTADPLAADYAWSFTTQATAACGTAAEKIHDIQGNGATSPVVGQDKTIEGVVVAHYQNTAGGEMDGFFVQEEDTDADADPATSEGIYVYDSANAVAVGDKVRVAGTVAEYIPTDYTLSLTELSPVAAVAVCSSGNTSPTAATVHLPVTLVTDLEAFEGMRVTIPEALTVADNYTLGRYGEVLLAQGGPIYQFTHLNAPSTAGNATYLAGVAKRSILLDDANTSQNRDPITYPAPGLSAANTLRAGDTLPSGISGVLDQEYATDLNAVFSRPPLAPTFEDNATGERFSVVVNHFKSKGCSGATGLDLDQGDGQGCWKAKRDAQATQLLGFINDTVIPDSNYDADVLIVGDLNSYAQEDPITTLKADGYTDLVNKYLGSAGYSYTFDGQLGYLDHALASGSLADQIVGAAEWHINADEPVSLDYNTEFKSAGQVTSLYAADRYRASDHDPVIVDLNLTVNNDLGDLPASYGAAWHTYSELQLGDTWDAGHATAGSGLQRRRRADAGCALERGIRRLGRHHRGRRRRLRHRLD
jgi:predicted extracellular nuclease